MPSIPPTAMPASSASPTCRPGANAPRTDRPKMRNRRPARTLNAIPQRPFGQVPRPYEPIKVISDDQVEAIHHAALRVLSEQGMRVLNARAIEFYRRAGA
ncbi:MAG: hypothetical protein E6Q73_13945, partial [Pseudorhodobacter sp.]